MAAGPLNGIKVIEFAGIGPGPLCGMLLSDMGADVIRIDRKGAPDAPKSHIYNRGRRSVALDLRAPKSTALCYRLCEAADILFEGYRPGVMERLGLGPDVVKEHNPKLVYGRMTGWGQSGPYAARAGHDINYIAITGALHAIGTKEKPVAPLSLVGDFGGGAMFLAFGLLAALLNAQRTGQGQVVDAAMCDGVNYLMGMSHALRAAGEWHDERASNLIDGGAPFYDTYQCADGNWISIGAIEPKFYERLIEAVGMAPELAENQLDRTLWPARKLEFTRLFAKRPRAVWCDLLEGLDVCFAPVLSLTEAIEHPHNLAREAFKVYCGQLHPAPAPRFSVTPGAIRSAPPESGDGGTEALRDWGLTGEDFLD